jgi:hypothetical protein
VAACNTLVLDKDRSIPLPPQPCPASPPDPWLLHGLFCFATVAHVPRVGSAVWGVRARGSWKGRYAALHALGLQVAGRQGRQVCVSRESCTGALRVWRVKGLSLQVLLHRLGLSLQVLLHRLHTGRQAGRSHAVALQSDGCPC